VAPSRAGDTMSVTPLRILPDPKLLSGAARLALRYSGTFAPETVQQLLVDSYRHLAESAAGRHPHPPVGAGRATGR
jgi:hypothetical protein